MLLLQTGGARRRRACVPPLRTAVLMPVNAAATGAYAAAVNTRAVNMYRLGVFGLVAILG